jgi:hypothetical protein
VSQPIKGFGEFKGHKPDVYSFQAVVIDVEVDSESGEVRIKHLYFVYDVGTIINPLIHQARSTAASFKDWVRAHRGDSADDGQTTASLGDYRSLT